MFMSAYFISGKFYFPNFAYSTILTFGGFLIRLDYLRTNQLEDKLQNQNQLQSLMMEFISSAM